MSDYEDNEINDPTVMKQAQTYNPDEDNPEEFSSKYLQTLYNDYKTKMKSASIYAEKIQCQQASLNKVVTQWTHNLKEKYEILDKFTQGRAKSISPGNFALEDRNMNPVGQDGDLKKVDSDITDTGEEIEYNFEKLEEYIRFLSSSYLDAQNTINKIYDRFMELYDNM